MNSKNICLAIGREAENVIINPFGLNTKVEWWGIESKDFLSNKNPDGSLQLTLWPAQDDMKFELECKNENDESCLYQVSLFRVPTTLEIEKGALGVINYPGDLWTPVSAQSISNLVEVELVSEDSCYHVRGLDSGYEEIKLLFENGESGTVSFNVDTRIIDQSAYKAEAEVPSFKGNCLMAVYKKGEQSPRQTLQLSVTGSIIVGRASASAPGYADVDLKPHLSQGALQACSRRQLKIMMAKDNKLYVENIGSVSVKVNDIYNLEPDLPQNIASALNQSQPRSLVYLHPDSSITIADEIVLHFKDDIKGNS